MACSEARIEANRRNAQLSTGPRTEAGKAVSRCNALKDGFTGEGKVLSPAIKADFEREYAHWSEHFQPVGVEEVSLVKILALTQSRMIPMHDEIARLDEQNRRYELDCGDGDRRALVQRWYLRMPDDPGLSVAEMTRTSIGCRWLADRWAAFENGLAEGGCRWRDDDLKRLFDLLGIPDEERHLSADVRAFEDLYKKAKAGDASAHASLLERVAIHRRRLIDEAERLEGGHEAYKRDMLESSRHVDLSPAMMRLRRLDAANLRLFARSLEQLRKLRAPAAAARPAAPKPEPPKPAPAAAAKKEVSDEPPPEFLAMDPRLHGMECGTATMGELWKLMNWLETDEWKKPKDEWKKPKVVNGVHMDIVAAAPGSGG